MRFYRLKTSATGSKYRGSYGAKRQWRLPDAVCPTCDTEYADLGLDLAAVNLSAHLGEKAYRKERQVPWDEYVRLRDGAMPYLPEGAVIQPGVGLGPLVGKATGSLPPFVLQDAWTLLVHGDVLEQMTAAGLTGLAPVESRITGNKRGPLYELALARQGVLGAGCQRVYHGEPCVTCGQAEYGTPNPWWLDAGTVPTLDVVRFDAMPMYILVSERFADFVARLDESGVAVEDVMGPLPEQKTRRKGTPQEPLPV
ncbi:double-CXXCG motif protein [Myxococcus sp. K38C18041901]|uniref:SitI6 family double-CXXCG motif immunity protein n=1 Tax=Myxococcus guangdongensis TaxID=2906760 RepID=UPI0020A6FA21|nr:double-CXXCG motif protein [Myxococcus guangdongensis]MCP3065710.1 double-CXXCG motif protein [Myxococcus guangdongensis]